MAFTLTKQQFFNFFSFLILLSPLASKGLANAQNALFTSIPAEYSGIGFDNVLVESATANVYLYQYMYNGGGIAAGDINNDGLTDLFFTGNMVSDRLYLNKGNVQFEDITKSALPNEPTGWSTGTTMADVNGDGWLDIYVCRSGQFSTVNRTNLLYINNGNNTFSEQAENYGLNDSAFSTQAAFFDMDADGDLDMFLLNHAVVQPRSLILGDLRYQRNEFAGNKLFRNDNGFFTDISIAAGIKGNLVNFGLGLSIGDINNDNYPDIYVTNDYREQDFLYLNNKNGTFTEVLNKQIGHIPLFSMGCDMADINNDGLLDLFVADMLPEDNFRQKKLKGPLRYDAYEMSIELGYYHQIMHNMLQLNNGNGTFSEIAYSAGVAATDWSWAPLIADFDNDGISDLYITNGYRHDFTDMDFIKYGYGEVEKEAQAAGKEINTLDLVNSMDELKISNYLFLGTEEIKFKNITASSGANIPSFSNGGVYADLDNDGDLDLIVNNINDTAFVFRNNSESINNNHYLKFKFKSSSKNASCIGTRINISTTDKIITRELMPTRGFQSSVEPIIHVGLGEIKNVDVEIIFPSGKRIFLSNQTVDTLLILDEQQANLVMPSHKLQSNLFEDVTTSVLNYAHNETAYIDYKREPLLPYKLSEQGPKLAVGDLNSDGLDDVFICGAKNKKAKLYLASPDGTFNPVAGAIWEADSAFEDIDAVIFDVNGDKLNDLYVVSGSNEYETGSGMYQDRLYINSGNGVFISATNNLPNLDFSKSCVKTNDLDGDGDLDLFLGGKLIPGKYPLAPQSMILLNNNGIFSDVTDNYCPELHNLGAVNDAVFADINGDKKNDLIIVGDWMPVQIFIRTGNRFVNTTQKAGMNYTSGWWNTITAADLDDDGDIDLIGGNRGTNHPIFADKQHPATIYTADIDANSTIDPIITYFFNDGKSYPYASKDDMLDQIPGLKKPFVYYKDYAAATMSKLFPGINSDSLPQLNAYQFESAIFRNNGNGTFSIEILPPQAQYFPVNSILIRDFNEDGFQDILIAGNNYDIRPESGRIDAGFGLLLNGNANHDFTAVPSLKSNVFIPGETRDLQIVSINRKHYLMIAKNHGSLQVLQLSN